MKRSKSPISASEIRRKKKEGITKEKEKEASKPEYDGNEEVMISTGSTLLDLEISGGRKRGGGIPGGIFVEIMGQKKTGKTILLCELAGAAQRAGGDISFKDPEARLNIQFALMFDLVLNKEQYGIPDTVTEVFKWIRAWKPKPKNKKAINGIFADSLAALSTDLEMDKEEGDKMGMRRAKEFSEELRKTCRILTNRNWLLVGSNQLRQTGNSFGEKYKSPGGEAPAYYASLRLKTRLKQKIKKEKTINGKSYEAPEGILAEVEVYDSSVWRPYGKAEIYIIFDYGIDDIRSNLQYLKRFHGTDKYTLDGDQNLYQSMNDSIKVIEEKGLEKELKEAVINAWETVQKAFQTTRKPKRRE